MLIERLQEVKTLLEAREMMRSERQTVQTLEKHLKAIKSLATRLDTLTDLASEFAPSHEQLQELRVHVEELRKKFADSISVRGEVTGTIEKNLNHIHEQISVRWVQHIESVKQSKQMHKARIVFLIADGQQKTRLDEYRKRVDRYLKEPIPTREVVAELQTSLSALNRQVEESFPDVPPEVQNFLERLTNQQASLLDATPSIIAWCAKYRLLERIILKLEMTS